MIDAKLASALKDTFPFEGARCGRITDAVMVRLRLADGTRSGAVRELSARVATCQSERDPEPWDVGFLPRGLGSLARARSVTLSQPGSDGLGRPAPRGPTQKRGAPPAARPRPLRPTSPF